MNTHALRLPASHPLLQRQQLERLTLAALLALLLSVALLSIAIGPVPIPITDVLRTLGALAGLPVAEVAPQHEAVILSIRLPRTLLGLLVGAGLAVAGAAMQGLFRNPLAARTLNALLLGEAEAGHLGIAVQRMQPLIVTLAALAVGAAVAVSGIIGFVGLVVPHLLRLALGPDHRLLLPGAALLGGSLLLLADLLARTLVTPAELPIGILTALIGGPFFLALLLRWQRLTR